MLEVPETKMPEKIEGPSRFRETLVIFRRSLIYQTKEFFQNSTLHGVRYIAETGRPAGEKFMWFCFTSMASTTALIIIMSLWERFQTNPTITGLDTDFVIQSVVFPTTVICPMEPYDADKAYELALNSFSNYDESKANETARFLKILSILNFTNIMEAYEYGKNVQSKLLMETDLRSLPFQILYECSDLFEICKYRDVEIKCCDQMQTLYTENGLCYAFNSRFKSTDKADIKAEQTNVLYETDKKWSFFVRPTRHSLIYIISDEEYFGSITNEGLNWNMDTVELRISKKTTYTTEDTRQLSIGQRKCIFNDEVAFDFFPDGYSYSSCMDECRIKKALKLCNCNPPFFKPIDAKMCGLEDFPCLYKHRDNITNMEACPQCELSCTNSVFGIQRLLISEDKPQENGLMVEFITWPIIRYKREVLFGWVDLLVSFGGIASLFLGFSILSGVEIIYYFTLRACCMIFKNRQELYEIEENIRKQPPPPIDVTLRIARNPLRNLYPNVLTNLGTQSGDQFSRRRKTEKDYAAFSRNLLKQSKNSNQYASTTLGQYLP